MKALINPQVSANKITGYSWSDITKQYTEIYEPIENSALICDFNETGFEVALPLFWVEQEKVDPFFYYYNTLTNTVDEIIHEDVPPMPVADNQPVVDGLTSA